VWSVYPIAPMVNPCLIAAHKILEEIITSYALQVTNHSPEMHPVVLSLEAEQHLKVKEGRA